MRGQLVQIAGGEIFGHRPDLPIDHLQASFAGQHDAFDFDAMARVLARTTPGSAMPESRRRRIEKLIAAIDSQRLYPAPGESGEGFIFDSCATAQAAYRERLPALVELAKSLAIAELEVAGVYDEGRHDAFFAQSDADTPVFDGTCSACKRSNRFLSPPLPARTCLIDVTAVVSSSTARVPPNP